jgi:hypothetical protein
LVPFLATAINYIEHLPFLLKLLLNKIGSKFCGKCRMVLSYDAYTEAVKDSETQKSQFELLAQDVAELKKMIKKK